MTDELKYYVIEYDLDNLDNPRALHEFWRYRSLYNGSRGRWHAVKTLAIEEGEAHRALIIALHMHMRIEPPTIPYPASLPC